jgi:hypothetical protein
MQAALILFGVAVLAILILVSLRRQHEDRVGERKVEAGRHSPEAKAQREESLRRRMGVRAAHAERVRVAGEPDAPAVGSDVDA